MPLTELYHSRVQTKSGRIEYVRVLECPSTEVQEAGGGWTGNGVTLPKYGDPYPHGTWTDQAVPCVGRVEVDPRFLVGVARVTAYYWAPLSRSAS